MGSERRGFEGYVPGAAAKARAGRWILVLRVLLLVSFALSLVMVVGKAVNGDPAFALVTLSNSLGSLALGLFIANPKLNEQPSWYVFLVGATAAMVVGAAADNSLRLEYAAPGSFSTSYVWLPFAFAAFGLLLSRSYVRSSIGSCTRRALSSFRAPCTVWLSRQCSSTSRRFSWATTREVVRAS